MALVLFVLFCPYPAFSLLEHEFHKRKFNLYISLHNNPQTLLWFSIQMKPFKVQRNLQQEAQKKKLFLQWSQLRPKVRLKNTKNQNLGFLSFHPSIYFCLLMMLLSSFIYIHGFNTILAATYILSVYIFEVHNHHLYIDFILKKYYILDISNFCISFFRAFDWHWFSHSDLKKSKPNSHNSPCHPNSQITVTWNHE